MRFGFLNNFQTKLGAALGDTAGDVTATLLAGQGAPFAAATADYQYAVTLSERDVRGLDLRREIVYVTARAGDDLTVVRAREGTTRQAWPAGTRVQARLTAGMLDNTVQPGDPLLDPPLVDGLTAIEQVNIVSGPLDLTSSTASVTLTMPAGKLLFVDDLDLVITASTTPGGTPQITAGPTGATTSLLAASTVTVTAVGDRQTWAISAASGVSDVVVSVSVAGTGTTYQARAVLRGYLLEV